MWLALVAPLVFVEEEERDNKKLDPKLTSSEPRTSVYKVRAGLFGALGWGGLAMLLGLGLGVLLGLTFGSVLKIAIGGVVLGTMILMWASLALQGWNIQTWDGVTLSERLNQWVFRTLYFVGTMLISLGSVWSLF